MMLSTGTFFLFSRFILVVFFQFCRGLMSAPESCGVSMPQNPAELLKLLSELKVKKNKNVDWTQQEDNNTLSRLKKQEAHRESVEKKMMEFEDYENTEEGLHRMNLFLDRSKMFVHPSPLPLRLISYFHHFIFHFIPNLKSQGRQKINILKILEKNSIQKMLQSL
jgi:histidyl-tRNA synthetase